MSFRSLRRCGGACTRLATRSCSTSGGNGPKRTLRTAARFAHEWNSIVLPPDAYRTSVEVLERHCADIDRDPAEIHTSMLLFAITGPDRATEDKVAQRFIDMMGHGEAVTVEDIRQNRTAHPAFVGSQEELIDRLGQLAEAGLQIAEQTRTALVLGWRAADVPGWAMTEIVVGDATLAWSTDEQVAALEAQIALARTLAAAD